LSVAIAEKSEVMLSADSPAAVLPVSDAELDSVLDSLDSSAVELSLLDWLLDSLDDGVDSFELAAGALLPHEAMTRLTENSAAAIAAAFLPTNIWTPFVLTVASPPVNRGQRDLRMPMGVRLDV
jgi:hypothetical protein